VLQLAGFQSISYGEMNGAKSERTERLHATLSGADFDATLSDAIEREMWEKWILLASLGGLTCLLRGTVGEIVAAPGGTETARALFGECVAIATACGHPPSAGFVTSATGMLTAGSPLTSSMYRDLIGGQAVEADQIVGDMLVRGRAVGVAAPLLGAAYAQLSIYQQRRAATPI
jgi:2-dehydropantoate 2-reductase